MISQAEFDSQRGSEEQESDSDLVFGPLDQDEPVSANSNTTTNTTTTSMATSSKSEQLSAPAAESDRRHGQERQAAAAAASKSSELRRKKVDKKARFYPVLNKKETPPSKVRQELLLPFKSYGCYESNIVFVCVVSS